MRLEVKTSPTPNNNPMIICNFDPPGPSLGGTEMILLPLIRTNASGRAGAGEGTGGGKAWGTYSPGEPFGDTFESPFLSPCPTPSLHTHTKAFDENSAVKSSAPSFQGCVALFSYASFFGACWYDTTSATTVHVIETQQKYRFGRGNPFETKE